MQPIDPNNLAQQVGRRVAELRSGLAITQAQLAENLGVSIRYLQSIEAGDENLSLVTLAKLGTALQAKPIRFFEPPATRKPRPGRPKKGA